MPKQKAVSPIHPLRFYERLAGIALIPIMFMLRGFKSDSLQETHPWHIKNIDARKVDLSLSVLNHGSDRSKYGKRGLLSFLFHAPIFGGWKDFSVYEVDALRKPFYVGWLTYRSSDDKLISAQLNRLKIKYPRIRLLDGNELTWGYYFAIDADGYQLKLRKVGQGKIGDKSYLDVRLF
jgi:hypothetical protein